MCSPSFLHPATRSILGGLIALTLAACAGGVTEVDEPGALKIETLELPPAVSGTSYSQSIEVSGGLPPYEFGVVKGQLPAGLSLSGNTISGVPTRTGSYGFTFGVADSATPRATAIREFQIIVTEPGSPLVLQTKALPDALEGVAYQGRLTATGGKTPYAFRIQTGTLPPGISLDANTGDVSGTSNKPGSYGFTVAVTDAASTEVSGNVTLVVIPKLILSTTTLPEAIEGKPYSERLAVTGGKPPYRFELTGGALPAGITLDAATGEIAGVPTQPGPHSFDVQVTDSLDAKAGHQLSLSVVAALAFTTTGLPEAMLQQAYSARLEAKGGQVPYRFSIIQGGLPGGIQLDPATGVLSGTPSLAGSYPFTAAVTDAMNEEAQVQLDLVVRAPAGTLKVWTWTLPNGTHNTAYTGQVKVTGGTTPYRILLSDGFLPSGLKLDQGSGALSGTPADTGLFLFRVSVTDAANQTILRDVRLTIGSSGGSLPTISMVPSRTAGVAPLSVFFDATGTTSSGFPKAFHHLDYQWDFGDPEGRHAWTSGPVAAHVFADPGTYRVQLTVVDPHGGTVTASAAITVTDPDEAFTGTNTVCFSNDSDFTGAPKGAKHVTATSFDAALAHYAAGKRLLFKRGHTFTNGSTRFLAANGPGVLGAFGKGTNPDERGIFADNPVISCTDTPLRFHGSDFTIMDLRFVDSGTTHSAINPDARTERVLIYRTRTSGFEVPMGWSHDSMQNRGLDPHDHNMIVDSAIEDCRLNAFYGGGTRLAYIGNIMARCVNSHLLRVTFANRCAIDGNVLHYPGGRRHAIKLHAHQDKTRYGQYTERVVIRDNDVRGESWSVAVAPQDALKDEQVRRVLIEKNRIHSIAGATVGVYLAASEVTVRNNLFIGAGSQGYDYWCIRVSRRGIEPIPSGVEIYNNTRFNGIAGHQIEYLVAANEHQGAILIENNLMWCPATKSSQLTSGSASTTLGGNFKGDPQFTDQAKLDLTLKPTSPAIGAGMAVPVLDDSRIKRRRRYAGFDAGANRR